MRTLSRPSAAPGAVREKLIHELKDLSLIHEDVTLSSGARASYFIDAKRMSLRPSGFRLLAQLVHHYVREFHATAVGGLTLGADALAYAALVHGTDEFKSFIVRKDPKPHGLQKLIEGDVEPGDRCLIVDDVVTSGASTIKAIKAIQDEGIAICGVLAVLDRLAGGAERIEAAAKATFVPLATIDEVFPDRPDRDDS